MKDVTFFNKKLSLLLHFTLMFSQWHLIPVIEIKPNNDNNNKQPNETLRKLQSSPLFHGMISGGYGIYCEIKYAVFMC